MQADLKILLVEDTEITRKVVAKMLEGMGYTCVHGAANGVVAWAELERACALGEPFGLVLADWRMMGMTGLELFSRMRSHRDYLQVPFIMMTSNKEKDSVMKAADLGVTAYLVKPFSMDQLRTKLAAAYTESKSL